MSLTYELIKSWACVEGNVTTNEEIDEWIAYRNQELDVVIEKIDFSYNGFWHYDDKKGIICNNNMSFFQIAGFQEIEDDQIVAEQPIIIQDEIGYLGIICKIIDGTLNFLMQAKVEPGNVNIIQLSPTIQATKSNFTRQHGGKEPAYLSYFANADKYTIVVDQLQSEQSSRFLKKRNRNMILLVDDEIEESESHRWMTLGQIKRCMKIDNLVDMDTRTVLSCMPFSTSCVEDGEWDKMYDLFSDKATYNSVFSKVDNALIHKMFNAINNYKMYRKEDSRIVPLTSLKGWEMNRREIVCKSDYDFKVIYCHIEIEDREVKYWEQPLVEAIGKSVFGLFTTVRNGKRLYLVRVKHEIGCFDGAELGPTIQAEPSNRRNRFDSIEKLFISRMDSGNGVIKKVILSEEGGRFYHEENYNVIVEVDEKELGSIPKEYFWVDYATLNRMIQFNNCVNIQLRNMMSLIDM